MTFISYNGHQHPPGEVNYQYRIDPVLNQAEFAVASKARVELAGKLITHLNGDAGQADLSAKIMALRAAYVDGGDLLFVLNSGQAGPTSIYSAQTLGGVRVIKAPEFPKMDGTQYVTQLDYSISLEAELPFSGAIGSLWSFKESLDFDGDGGPEIAAIRPLRGLVQIQTLHQFTEVVAVQKGEAVGYLARWSQLYQPPLWPALQNHAPGATRRGKGEVRAIGRGANRAYKLWPTTWYYTFVSPGPIDGEPALWPLNL